MEGQNHLITVKMAQNNNILQELKDLNSSLAEMAPGNSYTVPAGYFDGLVTLVLNRIKALEASIAAEELSYLSPLLNDLSRKMPYSVPAGYFEMLEENILPASHQSVGEELESISPLLSGLNKQMPYEVPQGYFETLGKEVIQAEQPGAKVVSLTHRKWFRFAAAAMITGMIGLASFLVLGKKDMQAMPLAKFERKLNKEIQKMSDTELAEFLESTEATMNGQENVSTNTNNEIKELLKDVTESEMKEFIEETSDLQTEPTMLN